MRGPAWARLSEAPRENLVPELPLNARVDEETTRGEKWDLWWARGDEFGRVEAHLLFRAIQIYPGGFSSIWLLPGVCCCKDD